MKIRAYQPSDCETLTKLFYNTVHTINARDCTKEQLDVWATRAVDLELWDKPLREHYSNVTPWDAAKAANIEFTEDALLLQMGENLNLPYIFSIDRQ